MARRLLVDDLVSEVRSLLDEQNEENISDETDILPALNRAQDYAANILARHYESPLLTYETLTLVGGQAEYDIPENYFEQRLEKVEINYNGTFSSVKRISYRDVTEYETTTQANIPQYYCVIGNAMRLIPAPTGSFPARIWGLKDPEPLVLSQGRITVVNVASNYVVVDEAGSDLSTLMDNLNSYVNIVDGQSGVIKASMQVQSINGSKITFKTVPTRVEVMNKDIAAAIPTTVALDDVLSVIAGSCVPFLKKPLANFLIQFASATLRSSKLGESSEAEDKVLKEFEKQVEHSWAGRETTLRVKKRNMKWNTRRYFYNT